MPYSRRRGFRPDFRRPNVGFAFNSILPNPPDVSLLLQAAVVDLGEQTLESDIILAVLPAWEEIARQIATNPGLVYEIDPFKWEEMMAGNYEKMNFFDEVTLTPRSGDFGRDIIAVKRGFFSVRIIESVKRYAPDHLVGADDVRALLGVLSGDRNATKGVISTTSDFAPRIAEDPFIAPFMPYRLELVDGRKLIERLRHAASTTFRSPQ